MAFYYANVNPHDRFDAYDVRRAAYSSLLAGACGHTYGNNNVWQMWEPGREPVYRACVPWREALDHAGAFQMGIVRRLFESRPFEKLVPDQGVILDGPHNDTVKVRAACASDGSFAFVYSPRGRPFTVRMDVVQSPSVQATWFDPRYGIAEPICVRMRGSAGSNIFVPPTSGPGNDWILVLDDARREFPPPGGAVD